MLATKASDRKHVFFIIFIIFINK